MLAHTSLLYGCLIAELGFKPSVTSRSLLCRMKLWRWRLIRPLAASLLCSKESSSVAVALAPGSTTFTGGTWLRLGNTALLERTVRGIAPSSKTAEFICSSSV